MSFISSDLERYIEAHSSPEEPIFSELRREAHLHLLQPRMLSGRMQGQLLRMLVALGKPRNILEIGSYSGYTTALLAKELEACDSQSEAKVHTIEACDECEDYIRKTLETVGVANRVVVHIGKAEAIIPQLVSEVAFDFVYIDANKRDYVAYYELLIDSLPKGALLLADNTLWSGKVLDNTTSSDSQTEGIRTFNQVVASDPRVATTILPLRDGLTMMLKQ